MKQASSTGDAPLISLSLSLRSIVHQFHLSTIEQQQTKTSSKLSRIDDENKDEK